MIRISFTSCHSLAIPGLSRRSANVKCRVFTNAPRNVPDKKGLPQPGKTPTPQEREKLEIYLTEASEILSKYDDARELMRRGKLVSKNAHRRPAGNTHLAQVGIFALFLAGFLATPFLGKKIAQDEEFRSKWIPRWYDFTVKKPENPWTREELHQQMLEVQRELHERAIAGDFAPDKLQEMQRKMQRNIDLPHRRGMDRSKIQDEWDRIHPGLDDDEGINED